MSKVTMITDVTAKPEHIEFVKNELEKLLEPTRQEKACFHCHLLQDKEHPAHFMFYEDWQSREAWQDSLNSDYVMDFVTASDGTVDRFTVYEMKTVG